MKAFSLCALALVAVALAVFGPQIEASNGYNQAIVQPQVVQPVCNSCQNQAIVQPQIVQPVVQYQMVQPVIQRQVVQQVVQPVVQYAAPVQAVVAQQYAVQAQAVVAQQAYASPILTGGVSQAVLGVNVLNRRPIASVVVGGGRRGRIVVRSRGVGGVAVRAPLVRRR